MVIMTCNAVVSTDYCTMECVIRCPFSYKARSKLRARLTYKLRVYPTFSLSNVHRVQTQAYDYEFLCDSVFLQKQNDKFC